MTAAGIGHGNVGFSGVGHGSVAGMSNVGAGVFGVGIDVIGERRIRLLLTRRAHAGERLFSEQERSYCDRFSNPYPHYAARFAAKEAVGKALGIGILGFVWREIEVISGGKPLVALHGHVALLARSFGVTRIELSLSHTGGQAYAVAIAVSDAAGAGSSKEDNLV
jgi:holo-[acyl-carrier protein] synthase